MADLTKEQLRQQNNTLFADNNSGNISAQDLRTFNDEIIDAVALDVNPSFTGSVLVQGDVSASTYYGDGSNLTGVTSQVPSGTVSGSSQIDYPLISNIPSGIISSSEQLPSGTVSSSQQIVDYGVFATTGSNNFIGEQVITGTISQFGGDYIDYVGGNIQTLGGRVGGTNMGYVDGSSNHTGSFTGDGSGLTNLPPQTLPSGVVSGSSQVSDITGSLLVTASFATQTLTFTKGDGTTFGVNIPDVSGSDITALNAFTASQEELNTTFATTGSNTFTGDQTINGTNLAPGSTFIAKDGNGQTRLQVYNATLKGITGADVLVNGNTILDGTVAIDDATAINGNLENTGSFTNGGNTTIVGTNLAPGNTFTAKDGNNTPRLQVNNASLGGITGADVIVNGNLLNDGNLTQSGSGNTSLQGDSININSYKNGTGALTFNYNNPTGTNAGMIIGQNNLNNTFSDVLFEGGKMFFGTGNENLDVAFGNEGTTNSINFAVSGSSQALRLQPSGITLNNDTTISGSVETTGNLTVTGTITGTLAQEGSFATTGSNTFVANQIISGNLDMAPNTAIAAQVLDAQEISTPTFLVDSIEPNTGTDITLNATNFVVSSSIQMAPNTAVVGPLFEATSEVTTPTLLVDTIEGNSDTTIDLLGRLKVSTAGEGDGRIEVNFSAGTYSHLYGTTLEFFVDGAEGAKYTRGGPLSRITDINGENPDGGMLLTGNSRAWSGLGVLPTVLSKAGAGIFYATGSSTETLPLASIKPINEYDNKIYIGNDVDSLVLTGSLVEVSGTMTGPVFEATSEAATPLLLVDSLEPNTDTKISITSAINLAAQDPLPTGSVGDLSVSGSNLYFYNGAWTQVV